MRPPASPLLPRRRVMLLVAGWFGSYTVGVALGFLLQRLGWWEGAGWERATLVIAHRTVSPLLDPFFLVLPYAGTNYTLAPVMALASLRLWRRGARMVALHLAVVQAGSWLLNPALKFTLARPRPQLFPARGQYAFASFPSGHSIAVVAVLVTVAYLLHSSGRGRWVYWATGLFFLLNSYSRLYLSVHWPTDVIGGTLIGALWLGVTLRAFRALS